MHSFLNQLASLMRPEAGALRNIKGPEWVANVLQYPLRASADRLFAQLAPNLFVRYVRIRGIGPRPSL